MGEGEGGRGREGEYDRELGLVVTNPVIKNWLIVPAQKTEETLSKHANRIDISDSKIVFVCKGP